MQLLNTLNRKIALLIGDHLAYFIGELIGQSIVQAFGCGP